LAIRHPGLFVDGDFGEQTITALQTFLTCTAPIPNSSNFTRVIQGSLQLYLERKGFPVGGIDGDVGPGTVKALQRYLSKATGRPIQVDGIFGKETTTSLQRHLQQNNCSQAGLMGSLDRPQ